MMIRNAALLLAALVMSCAPTAAYAQRANTLPVAATLNGTERIFASQGTGCATNVAPCASVSVQPPQIAAYLAPTFQPKDADLDAIAALATTGFGRQLLSKADASSIRTYLNLSNVAASGLDTDLTGAAWTAYTPTLTCATGTLTTATATGRYKRIGKSVLVQIRAAVTVNGSCAAALVATLPFAVVTTGNAADIWTLPGHESGPSGSRLLQALAVQAASSVSITVYNNTYPAADNVSFTVSGIYEGA